MTWLRLLNEWEAIAADLHERFGIDVEDDELMYSRSWFWLQDRILALLYTPPVLQYRTRKKSIILPATRIQWALDPPKLKE